MTDVLTLLKALDRPRLLVRAARFAQAEYRRELFLRRLFKVAVLPGSNEIALRLLEIEAVHNENRHFGAANYSALRHIEVLAALMTEYGHLKARAGTIPRITGRASQLLEVAG